MDITVLLPLLESTSGVALSCREFAWRVRSNSFPIKTSEAELCLGNLSFYKLLNYRWIDEWINTRFFVAIDEGNLEMLQILLENGANIEARDNCGDSSGLMRAVLADKTDCLKLLLERGANIEGTDRDGSTVLIDAAEYGKTVCLEILLEHKADIEARKNGEATALMRAARFGKPDCLKLLLQKKANIEATDCCEETSLIMAAFEDNTDCLKLLLEYGAKVTPYIREKYSQYAELWGP